MRPAVILLGILLAGFGSYAQKIKYKDLYILLRAKNYNDASGFLKTFLTQEPEHPNANYQMGLMLEYKLKELDLLKETDSIIARADSAILYFNKSHDLINDKEIKKHSDDYYELFKRRNLRTGKFEVILSDVQLDIENRVKSLNEMKVKVGKVKELFSKSMSFYESARTIYEKLKQDYTDELTLSLGANDGAVAALKELAVQYDSAFANFKAYKSIRKDFEWDDYKDILINSKAIEAFSNGALEQPDFYSNKVNVYNFSSWSSVMQLQIEDKKIFIEKLISFDESLDQLAATIIKDSSDLSSEVFGKITSPVLKDLKQIDQQSWLTTLFQYKISQLNLNSAWMGWYSAFADTLDVGAQLNYAKKIQDQMRGVSKIGSSLGGLEIDPVMLKYHDFVDSRFSGSAGLTSYVGDQKTLVEKENEKIESLVLNLTNKDKWGWWRNDSISLSLDMDTLRYTTLYSDSLLNRAYVVSGIYFGSETPEMYFGLVPSSRMIDTLYQVAVPDTLVREEVTKLKVEASKTTDSQYVLLITSALDNHRTLLAKANLINGIQWIEKIDDVSLPATLSVEGDHIQLLQEGVQPIVFDLEGKKVEEQVEGGG